MRLLQLLLAAGVMAVGACARSTSSSAGAVAPSPQRDARVGLRAGLHDAAEAKWNVKIVSKNQPTGQFVGSTNSDLAFTGNYAIQGNYNGFLVWDVSNPASPKLTKAFYCPALQSDVSVYKNLLFVSGEGLGGRLDCGGQGVRDTVSTDRLRGIRIFDISDITNPKYVANVQTCRGSHTHTVLVDPKDSENVYVYVSGSAPVQIAQRAPGLRARAPGQGSQLGALPH